MTDAIEQLLAEIYRETSAVMQGARQVQAAIAARLGKLKPRDFYEEARAGLLEGGRSIAEIDPREIKDYSRTLYSLFVDLPIGSVGSELGHAHRWLEMAEHLNAHLAPYAATGAGKIFASVRSIYEDRVYSNYKRNFTVARSVESPYEPAQWAHKAVMFLIDALIRLEYRDTFLHLNRFIGSYEGEDGKRVYDHTKEAFIETPLPEGGMSIRDAIGHVDEIPARERQELIDKNPLFGTLFDLAERAHTVAERAWELKNSQAYLAKFADYLGDELGR